MKTSEFNFYLKLKLMEQGLESAERMVLNQCFLCADRMLNQVGERLCTVRQCRVKVEKGTPALSHEYKIFSNK